MYRYEAGHAPCINTGTDAVRLICTLNWRALDCSELVDVAWAYYYFSVQFRENVELARDLYPDDELLGELDRGERDTDNLSPWPGVAAAGERMNHDEFMRRALLLTPIESNRKRRLESIGTNYLARVKATDTTSRVHSLASYENGGLMSVFLAILTAPTWDEPVLRAFKYFLERHIHLDSDPNAGHGALCRHLVPNHQVVAPWLEFHRLLVDAVPKLSG
jgi:hypothetical protein